VLYRKIVEYLNFARRCLSLLAGERRSFGLFVALAVVAALSEGITVSLLVPILEAQGGAGGFSRIPVLGDMSRLFGDLSPSARIQTVAIAMAAALILRNVVLYVVDVLGTVTPLRLEQTYNLRSYAALMSVEIAYINENDFGTLSNGLGGWSQRVSQLLTNAATIVYSALIVAVYIVLMLVVSWQLTALAVLFVALMSLLLKWFSSAALKRAGERWSEAVSRVNQVIMESVTGMKVVRLAAAERLMTGTYSGAVEQAIASQRQVAMIQLAIMPLLSLCAGLFICALLFGIAAVRAGESLAWVAPILLFLLLVFRLMGPVSAMNTARSRIVVHMHALDMLTTFYAAADRRRQPNGTLPVNSLRKELVFDRVTFTYPKEERAAVVDFSASIGRGQMVAVVGPSGAGKSTLIALVARFYDPQQGRILVDDVDLRDLDVGSWRRRLAVVTQDTFIFNDTVANNIAFGRGEVPPQRIRAAAELAAATEFIEKLPQGYDTMLGDRGVRLSGGQQQRLAIARAILAEPDLIVFDEATSHLDTFTERAIQEAMERMSGERTVLVIAHRLSTIRKADKVLVMQDGRVVEEGRHQALLARRGVYWEMVEHQRIDLVEGDAEQAAVEAHA
jgi:ATP-binding cassette, subfamily B, bacterial MsbA